jgi:type VI protein secretion system component Hcp
MKVRGLMVLVACLLVAGAGSAQLSAAKSAAITVTVSGLGCSTAAGGNSFNALSWSWGATNVTSDAGGGSGSGKAVVSALALTRTTDACSPALLGGVVTGKHFPSLSLTQYDDGGAITATVVLNDVLLAGWRIGSSDTSAQATEEVQVSFARFTLTDVASGNKFCWDLAGNKGC